MSLSAAPAANTTNESHACVHKTHRVIPHRVASGKASTACCAPPSPGRFVLVFLGTCPARSGLRSRSECWLLSWHEHERNPTRSCRVHRSATLVVGRWRLRAQQNGGHGHKQGHGNSGQADSVHRGLPSMVEQTPCHGAACRNVQENGPKTRLLHRSDTRHRQHRRRTCNSVSVRRPVPTVAARRSLAARRTAPAAWPEPPRLETGRSSPAPPSHQATAAAPRSGVRAHRP